MAEFKNKTENDLIKLLNEKRTALQLFRFGSSGSKTRDVKQGRTLKREIAQVLTELSSRNIKA